MVHDAGGTPSELVQALFALHHATPFHLVLYVNSGARMITWSNSGPLDEGIVCVMAIKVSWRSVGGLVGLPLTPRA